MTLLPKDRRGLGEIVAVTGMTVSVSAVIVAQIFKGQQPSTELIGALIALCLYVAGRGFQSASERGASSEQRDRESIAMREARDELKAATARLEMMSTRMLDTQIEHYLPSPPRTGDKT